VDGDTIHCDPVGRIRLIGMDTPEAAQAPFGDRATRALADLIPEGTEVRVEPDVEDRDQYDRALRYVWTDDGMANWTMVRLGYAVVLTIPPNAQYADWMLDAQAAARNERAGLWAVDGFACPPGDYRRQRCR
jgi:micrococcal nuclease